MTDPNERHHEQAGLDEMLALAAQLGIEVLSLAELVGGAVQGLMKTLVFNYGIEFTADYFERAAREIRGPRWAEWLEREQQVAALEDMREKRGLN